ncbi:MAG: hypothetical protein LBC62_09485 [Treponema sp.]|nr:hypothetical protein [Treponema sp.]
MDKPKIYLETTMFNFPFVPDKPGYAILKADTKKVFDLIRAGKVERVRRVNIREGYKERLFQNFSFWNSFFRFNGKTGLLTGFSKSLSKTNRVLEQAQEIAIYRPAEVLSL